MINADQVREGLRQIAFLLEEELAIADRDEVHAAQVAQVLQIRGLGPSTAPTGKP